MSGCLNDLSILKRNLSVRRSAFTCTNCDVATSGAQESIYIQLSYALITAVFIYFVLLVTTRLIQDKPKHVLEHKQKTETILEAKRNEIREQKRREGTFQLRQFTIQMVKDNTIDIGS